MCKNLGLNFSSASGVKKSLDFSSIFLIALSIRCLYASPPKLFKISSASTSPSF